MDATKLGRFSHQLGIGLLFGLLNIFMFGMPGLTEARQRLNISETATKSYEEEEEGKLVPYRTFLTTWEIVVICVCVVILVVLLTLLLVYVCVYGCRIPKCCRRRNKEYSQIEIHRERKIGEIWRQPVRA